MNISIIPDQWETQRLVVSDSVGTEIPVIQDVCDACSYINEWTGWNPDDHPGLTMETVLRDGELPPNGSKEFFKLQTIRLKNTKEVIGFFEFYHGFPDENTFFVLYLTIHPKYQRKGYGQEAVRSLCPLVRGLGYTSIRLVVALKNWPAIRFWVKSGFNYIVDIRGDPIYSTTTFADLILEIQFN